MKKCQAWVERTNSSCVKSTMIGSNYCFWHYPKTPTLIMLIIGLLLPIIFNKPITHFLSRCPLFYFLDETDPYIESIMPDLRKTPIIDKNTTIFKVVCSDKNSGLNLRDSNIKISYKEKEYSFIKGKIDKANFELTFTPLEKLRYGEYLFEVILIDKANNKYEFTKPFVVRDKDSELTASVGYDTYKNVSDSDRKVFNYFFESKTKGQLESLDFYIYKLTISNNDQIAVLKDFYLTIDMPDMFFGWEQIGNFNAKRANIFGSDAESFDKRLKGRVYINKNFLNIEEIGPTGSVTFLILGGRDRRLLTPKSKKKIWEGIHIDGTYSSEGYGSSESRKVDLRIPKEQFKSLK
jgi:hypothetical protein